MGSFAIKIGHGLLGTPQNPRQNIPFGRGRFFHRFHHQYDRKVLRALEAHAARTRTLHPDYDRPYR